MAIPKKWLQGPHQEILKSLVEEHFPTAKYTPTPIQFTLKGKELTTVIVDDVGEYEPSTSGCGEGEPSSFQQRYPKETAQRIFNILKWNPEVLAELRKISQEAANAGA